MTMKTLKEIRSIIQANRDGGRNTYEGLTDSEIGQYNQFLMWGENAEAFPGQEAWARITD